MLVADVSFMTKTKFQVHPSELKSMLHQTMSIRNLVETTGAPAILAVTCPKNNDDEQALGDQLFTALGVKLPGHWRTCKPKLWTYKAGLTDVQEETLGQAADLLMLRRDTFRIIDGAGSGIDDQDASSGRSAQADLIDEQKAGQAPAPKSEQDTFHKGVLRFKSHNRRKTRSLLTEPRWVRREMIWEIVGGACK
jgi:hypothetical protein